MKIFISYRRSNGIDIAGRVRDYFVSHGCDIFYDISSMQIGKFDEQIYNQIEQCDYFFVILTPGSLERCNNTDDWVRREIEHAITHQKKIVPIIKPDFEFPEILPDSINDLRRYEGIEYSSTLFEFVMQKLYELLKTDYNSKTISHQLKNEFSLSRIRLQNDWLKKFKNCCEKAFGYSNEIDFGEEKSSYLFFSNNVLCFMDRGGFVSTALLAEDIFDIRYTEGDEFSESSVVILFKNGYSLYYYGFDSTFDFNWMLNGATIAGKPTGSLCGARLKEFFDKNE